MDEPSPCLLRSYSQPSDSSREANEIEGHIAHAFGGSVSFGRFMSETLDWVKFSTFSQNRYLEEAEKCLRPGLVAQKTAYFEVYFKDVAARKAAALVEEADREIFKSSTDISFVQANVCLWNIDAAPITTSPSSSDVEENELENERLECSVIEEQQACAESVDHVEISIELGNVDSDANVQEGHVPVKESDNVIVTSAVKKKRRVPSTKSLVQNAVPKIPSPPSIKPALRPPIVVSNAAKGSKKAVPVPKIPSPPSIKPALRPPIVVSNAAKGSKKAVPVPKIPSPPSIKPALRPPIVVSNAAKGSKKAVLVIPSPPVGKRLAPMAVHTTINFATSSPVRPQIRSSSVSSPVRPQIRSSSVSSPVRPQIRSLSVSSPVRPQIRSSSVSSQVRPQIRSSSVSSPVRPQIRSSSLHVASCKIHPDITSQTSTRASTVGTCKDGSNTSSPTPNKASACKTWRESSRTSRVPKRASDHGATEDSSKTLQTRTKQASVCGTSGGNSNTSQPLRVSANKISKVKGKASQTLNMASIGIESKRPSVTTRAENRRTKTKVNNLVSGATTGTAVSKWYSQSVDQLNSVKADGNKSRSTTKAIPFCFRIDERAAKRKKFHEKFEGKSDSREAEKGQLHTGSKRRTEHSFAKLRQSASTGLKTNQSVAPHMPQSQSLNNHSRKIPPTQPRLPNLGRKAVPTVQDKITRTPVKSSTSSSTPGSKHALEKGHRTTCSVPSLHEKNAIENASPNIQK